MDTSSFPSIIEDLVDSGAEEGDYERIWALLRRVDEKRGEDYDVDEAWAEIKARLDVDVGTIETDGSSGDSAAEVTRRTASRSPRPSGAPTRRFQDG